eukprot:11551618-Alexandrium_andersonii.AAC.1
MCIRDRVSALLLCRLAAVVDVGVVKLHHADLPLLHLSLAASMLRGGTARLHALGTPTREGSVREA